MRAKHGLSEMLRPSDKNREGSKPDGRDCPMAGSVHESLPPLRGAAKRFLNQTSNHACICAKDCPDGIFFPGSAAEIDNREIVL